jgi:hypothetical protein
MTGRAPWPDDRAWVDVPVSGPDTNAEMVRRLFPPRPVPSGPFSAEAVSRLWRAVAMLAHRAMWTIYVEQRRP